MRYDTIAEQRYDLNFQIFYSCIEANGAPLKLFSNYLQFYKNW